MKKISIQLTQDQLDAIKATGILDEKNSEWYEPKEDEWYRYLASTGVGSYLFNNDVADHKVLARQQVFRTREEADREDNKRIARTAILKWKAENCPFEPDWANTEQWKWDVYYDHESEELDSWRCSYQESPDTIYFASEEDADRCIEECKEHWLTLVDKK